MKRLIQFLFDSVGLEIRRKKRKPKRQPQGNTMISGINRFSVLSLPIASVIDVGAATGNWSIQATRVWPGATYLLMEPLLERKSVLESLTKLHTNFKFLPFAAGKEKTTVNFIVTEDLDGSGVARSETDPATVRAVQVMRIDHAVEQECLKGPFVIKLDTHGFEVPILEGCSGILQEVSLFIIECYGFQIVDNSLLFWEMCQYMDNLGFRLFDVVDVVHRPMDGAFWQCDAFFIKKSNRVFTYNSYKE